MEQILYIHILCSTQRGFINVINNDKLRMFVDTQYSTRETIILLFPGEKKNKCVFHYHENDKLGKSIILRWITVN